jgi:hypothetical protein
MFRRSGVKNSLVESFNKCVLFYRSFSENWTQKQMEKILRMLHVFTQFLLMLMTKRILLVNQKCDVK